MPLAQQFHHGMLLPIEDDPEVGVPFTDQERRSHALAKTICSVVYGLIEYAPETIGDHYDKMLKEHVDKRIFDAHPELKSVQDELDKKNRRGGNGLLTIAQLCLPPFMMTLMSNLASLS